MSLSWYKFWIQSSFPAISLWELSEFLIFLDGLKSLTAMFLVVCFPYSSMNSFIYLILVNLVYFFRLFPPYLSLFSSRTPTYSGAGSCSPRGRCVCVCPFLLALFLHPLRKGPQDDAPVNWFWPLSVPLFHSFYFSYLIFPLGSCSCFILLISPVYLFCFIFNSWLEYKFSLLTLGAGNYYTLVILACELMFLQSTSSSVQ